MRCDEVRAEIATALLTRSPLGEAAASHVAGCDDCAFEAEQLREVSALLALADPPARFQDLDRIGSVDGLDAADPALLTRLLADAAARRHRRRLSSVLAVAAVVVLVPLAVWSGVTVAHHDGGRAGGSSTVAGSVERTSSVDHVTGVSGVVSVQPVGGGSHVALSVTGVPAGADCTLTVVGHDGTRTVVTRWRADYAGTGSAAGTVALDPASIARVELLDGHGKVLLPVPLA